MKNAEVTKAHHFLMKEKMQDIPDVLVSDHSRLLNALFKLKDELKDCVLCFEQVISNIEFLTLFQ